MSTCLGLWSSLILAHELLFAKPKAARLVKAKDFMLCILALCTKNLAGNQSSKSSTTSVFLLRAHISSWSQIKLGNLQLLWSRYLEQIYKIRLWLVNYLWSGGPSAGGLGLWGLLRAREQGPGRTGSVLAGELGLGLEAMPLFEVG